MTADSTSLRPSPARLAATLAQCVAAEPALPTTPPFAPPGAGSADARVDLKLLAARLHAALATRGTAAARARLAGLDAPDLRAGTVPDGVARGLLVAYEEALSLCAPEPAAAPDPFADPLTEVATGKELRKRREHLIASGGSRVRFSRKSGVHLIDRDAELNVEHCVAFEDRRDAGTLDGFVAVESERPRLFSPSFLQAARAEHGKAGDRLTLRGRLGRTPHGFPCELVIEGHKSEPRVSLRLRIENRHDDHRLRIRFVGLPAHVVHTEGAPEPEEVAVGHRRFLAYTLVRACGRLQVGDAIVAVPGAQVHGWIEHRFWLGK